MPLAASRQPVPRAIPDVQRMASSIFNPEFDFLLACCTSGSKIEGAERIHEILSRPLDWKRVISLAEHHSVIPQVYRSLPVFPDLALPDSLRQAQERNARQTLWLTRELLHILGKLNSRGIVALPYKGPVLAQLLYGNVSMRQFSDLDLLIHSSDLSRIKSALAELGYEPGIELTQCEERDYLKSGYEYTFDAKQGRNLVEVQWRILPRFYSVDFDVGGFFQRAIPCSVSGMTVRTLCAEDLILVLCVHAAKHAWQQLSWLCDIAELARSRQIDWNAVQEEAKRLGVQRIVATTFFLTHKLLKQKGAPSKLCLGGSFASIENLTNEIIPTLAEGADYNTETISYFWLMIRVRERWRDRIKFLWRLIVTPSIGEWSAIHLPAPLFPLYRAVRTFRLLSRFFLPKAVSSRETGRSGQ
jgi:putative nucleotidyltransferase-like protein